MSYAEIPLPAFTWPLLLADVEFTFHDDNFVDQPLTATAATAVPRNILAPLWQVIVLGDGSLTRTLGLLTGSPTTVNVIEVVKLADSAMSPPEVSTLSGALVRRRVWIENERRERLAYAVSWWNGDVYERLMPCPSIPIGTSLNTARLEVDRRIASVWRARLPPCSDVGSDLWHALGCTDSDEVWMRSYCMVSGGDTVAVICEVFSPSLSTYLGPSH